MLRGQRSQVRKRGGEGHSGASLRKAPPGQEELTQLWERAGRGGLVGSGRVWGLGLFYCILCWRHYFPGETKGLQPWRPAPLGGRFAPGLSVHPRPGRPGTQAQERTEFRGLADHPTPPPDRAIGACPLQILSGGAQN